MKNDDPTNLCLLYTNFYTTQPYEKAICFSVHNNFPTEAYYDRLTFIKCTEREKLEVLLRVLQRQVMPFNGLVFRDLRHARGSKQKSVWALCDCILWWLGVSYLYKLWTLSYNRLSRAPSSQRQTPSLRTPTQRIHCHAVLMHMEPLIYFFFSSTFNFPDNPLFNSQSFITVLGLKFRPQYKAKQAAGLDLNFLVFPFTLKIL